MQSFACSAPFRTFVPVLISPTMCLARPVSGFTQFWRGLNEIVINTILLTDAVNIKLSDNMKHGVNVDMTDVLSTDDNGD